MGRASNRKRQQYQKMSEALFTPDPVSGVLQAVHAPDGAVKYELNSRKLPSKISGQHRMIVTVMFTVTMESLILSQQGQSQNLDMENLVDYQSGCWDCEQPYAWCLLNPKCPGDPSGIQHD